MQHLSDPQAANVNIPAQIPTGRIYLEATQHNVPDGSFQKILFDTISAGFTDGIEDIVNHRILPGVAGFYSVFASLELEGLIDQKMYNIHLTKNGFLQAHVHHVSPMTGGGTANHLTLHVSSVIYMTAISYFEVGLYHNDATHNVDVLGETTGSYLAVQRVR